ncbi:MAG: sigma-70 family RNA polymerase sigma factor [Thermoleophilia bacterium]|nr:sigma-70 family RNA polymerase sigma factor [Thermoleophilia bacterium]MDH4339863.1 sigma-70 family RNA polymerase sigma factor [Thermoleophilia bacterium]MDH5279692.1 sigma-70 family RNA polymerase sigma factor [Thermoleophilia bacterium]
MAVTESGHRASSEVDELYRKHGGEIYRYALAVLGNHADAEDVTQTTFLNAYRSLEQGVRPRKPANWLLTIASNSIKQRFRQEQTRPRQVELDERTTEASRDEDDGPSVGELLVALSKIPPQQRQAIVLREFEGRSYAEIAEILGVTTTALETLLFRARRSLADELEHQLTCTEAQLGLSRAADGRLGRKERRRLRDHVGECPDCARFTSIQQRNRRALKGLMLVPIPLSLSFFKGIEGTATAATMPVATGAAVAGSAVTTTGATGGGIFAGGIAVKAAAVVAAATMTGGVAVVGSSEIGSKPATKPGARLGQVAPRGVLVPGNGVARGKAAAPGQAKRVEAKAHARATAARTRQSSRRSAEAKASARGQTKRTTVPLRTARPDKTPPTKARANTGSKAEKTGTSAPAKASSSSSKTDQPNGRASGHRAP